MICGGTMSGNCASGNVRIDTKPASMVMMAMTMATMGRRTKNSAMGYRAPLAAATGMGFTVAPWRAYCMPPTTTRSPASRP